MADQPYDAAYWDQFPSSYAPNSRARTRPPTNPWDDAYEAMRPPPEWLNNPYGPYDPGDPSVDEQDLIDYQATIQPPFFSARPPTPPALIPKPTPPTLTPNSSSPGGSGGAGGAGGTGGGHAPGFGYTTGTFYGGGKYPLASVMGEGLMQPWTTPFQAPNVTDDPGYQWRLDQGLKSLSNNAAARGTLRTGGYLKDFQNYAQGLASQEYEKAYGRAFGEYSTAYGIYEANQAKQFGRLRDVAGLGATATSYAT